MRPSQAQCVDLELIERDAWVDMYAAAPDAVRSGLGVESRSIDDGTLLMCRAIDHIQFNRLTALGLTRPVRAEALDAAVREFAGAGLKNWIVHVPPVAAGLLDACTRAGLRPHPRAWVKFHRGPAPLDVQPQLTLSEAGAGDAGDFGATAAAAFGLPPPVATWLAALVGRPRWHCFIGREGTKAVAAGALYADGALAWLGVGGTLASHRRLGGQSALLAARIRRAGDLGCTLLTTETGLPHPGEQGPSYANIQRAGFQIAYVRPNLTKA